MHICLYTFNNTLLFSSSILFCDDTRLLLFSSAFSRHLGLQNVIFFFPVQIIYANNRLLSCICSYAWTLPICCPYKEQKTLFSSITSKHCTTEVHWPTWLDKTSNTYKNTLKALHAVSVDNQIDSHVLYCLNPTI